MGRSGAGSGPGAVCVGGRASRRQGQWPEGIRTGRGNVCVGRRPEGVTTGGTGFGPGGTSYVRAVGGGGAAAGEARAAYDAICGAGRRWHAVRRPHACAVAGNPDGWRDPKAGAGGPGGVDSERRCGRGGMVPGAGDVPEPGRQRGAVVSFVESALGKTAPPRHGVGGRGGTW